jgi:hypothetical protein
LDDAIEDVGAGAGLRPGTSHGREAVGSGRTEDLPSPSG